MEKEHALNGMLGVNVRRRDMDSFLYVSLAFFFVDCSFLDCKDATVAVEYSYCICDTCGMWTNEFDDRTAFAGGESSTNAHYYVACILGRNWPI